ncbi:hypothetical protein [Kribbella sp. HUAS MG21]|uniref:Uncharacterized protein n=1 Tax=Kribbella sp. HUAS MG21 TaxID=3160966 RepID=A0AAU7T5U8_9ACTN
MIHRVVAVDQERLRREAEIPPEVGLVATVSWTSSTSQMSDSTRPIWLTNSGPCLLDAVLPGDKVGGVLRIRTTVAIANAPDSRALGIARLPGSVLAEDRAEVALEGTMSMFPVHGVDFSHTNLHPSASWHLEGSPDLHAPFMGTFRLLLNRLDTELMKAVERGAKTTRQQALVDELTHGVAVLLLELAVAHRDELSDRDIWPADSVGEVLSRCLAQAGDLREPSGPQDLPRFRSTVAGIVRAGGQGRMFE